MFTEKYEVCERYKEYLEVYFIKRKETSVNNTAWTEVGVSASENIVQSSTRDEVEKALENGLNAITTE